MPGSKTTIIPTTLPGVFPMLKCTQAAIRRFEDSPAGLCLGLIVVFSPLALLALNEAGVR